MISAYGRDLDDNLLNQALYMSADADASYEMLNNNKDMHIICALPAMTLKQFKRKTSSTFMLLAVCRSKLVGMACMSKYKKNIQYLHTVYVRPLNRRHGIGKALVKRALRCAKKSKCSLMLNVNPLNDIAISLYKSLGFKPCKEQSIRMEMLQ